MIDVRPVFAHLALGTSRLSSVQEIRRRIDEANDAVPGTTAVTLIKMILGIDREYADPVKARLVAMAVGEEAWRADMKIDNPEEFLTMCEKRIDAFMADKRYAFVFARADVTRGAPTAVAQVVDGLDVQVAVKADGKIKKGGRELLVKELYRTRVIEASTKMTCAEFKQLLVKQIGLTPAGASTYAYNVDKDHHLLIKGKRGRKANP